MNELALFAGAGGGILGGKLLGWRTVCAVERDAYAAQVLAQRQNDGILEPFPIWSDVCSFDGKPWRGIVDVISGGFPCQDISVAGGGAGIEGARSGLWSEFARIISDVQPAYVFVENSPMLTTRGLGTVLGDLAKMGFDAEWGVLSAADVGAPHRRERIWILAKPKVADPHLLRCVHRQTKVKPTKRGVDAQRQPSSSMEHENDAIPSLSGLTTRDKKTFGRKLHSLAEQSWRGFRGRDRYSKNAGVICGINDGMADRVDRLKAIGNGQVSLCAATAFELLRERLKGDLS